MRKSLIALVVLVFFALSSSMAFASQLFSDMPASHWAAKDVYRMKAKGAISGVSATSFAPNNPVTFEQLVVMLVRVIGKQGEAAGTIPVNFAQRDKVSSYAVGSVAYAVREGIITGSLLQKDPTAAASRHEVAEIVGRAMGLADEAALKQYASLNYADAASIPLSSRGFVVVMKEKGIMAGSSDGKFAPFDPLTRAQIASILNRVDNQVKKLTANSLKGSIYALSSSSITVEDASGIAQAIPLAGDVLIFKGSSLAGLTGLNAGEMVEIIKDSNGRAIYIEQGNFTFDDVTIEGEITNIVIGQQLTVISIKQENGTADNYTLGTGATIRINGEISTVSQLVVGHPVTAKVSGKTINSLEVSNVQRIINGTIKQVNSQAKTLTVDRTQNAGEIVITVDNSTKIYIGTREYALADLVEGQQVMIIATGLKASRIDAQHLEQTISGTITAVSFSPEVAITILNKTSQKEETYKIDANVIVRREGKSVTLRDILPGDEVDIDLKNRVATKIYATKVQSKASGTVQQIIIATTPTIVIMTEDGEEARYPVASGARIRKDGSTILITEIGVGDWVELQIEGQQAVRVDVEARMIGRYVIGTIENIHTAAMVLVISEIESQNKRQVFLDDNTTIFRFNRTRSIDYLSQGDEIIVVGYYDGGLFWATTIVVVSTR